ncbi:MAG: L-lactate dehydrogenase [Dechloromonas sp.]|nr:MAG: L-lactate dehydrogenase [Dechloromonas sp.]
MVGRTLNILPATTLDYRRLAEKRLPRFLFDYIDGGANDEITLAANVSDFRKIRIRQRVLRDVSNIDTATLLAGEPAAMPVILAPVGMAGLYARRGEVQTVRAANAKNVPFTLSTVGICTLDEVAAAATQPFWFQLYMIRDRGTVRNLLERAQGVGCTTLVFTVDLPLAGMRHRDTRNGMLDDSLRGKLGKVWQLGTRPGWIYDVGVRGKPHSFGNLAHLVPDPTDLKAYRSWIDAQFDTSVTWKDIEWLRGIWKGRLILKGIQEPDDALAAAGVGADGVVVSNHGARQLDSVNSSISKLPGVVAAVGERLEVTVDGGVRSGLDVFKAVALGARGVMIGRPWAWALAAGGEAAVAALLATFRRELEVAMALSGVTTIGQIGPDQIDPA